MSNYSSDFDTSNGNNLPPPLPPQTYSLEEYIRLRDTLNANKAKFPEFSEEVTLGFFGFAIKYIIPLIIITTIFAPLSILAFGVMGIPMFIMLAVAGFLIYSLPSISRAMRKQEAIDLAKAERAEYESFLAFQEKQNKKRYRKR